MVNGSEGMSGAMNREGRMEYIRQVFGYRIIFT